MVLRRGWGDSPPPSLDGPSGFAGNELRDYKSKSGTGLGHLNMASCPEKLLEAFEEFQVEQILSEIKKEWVLDPGVSEFGELLEEEHNEPDALSNQKLPWDPAEIRVFKTRIFA